MTKRNEVAVILLSLITCGIYTIYWFYVTTEELNKEEANDELMNYILAFLLSLVTCGIYGIYWEYKFFSKVDKVLNTDNCLLNFLLSLFLTPIVGMAITQDSMNKNNL